MFTGLGFPEMIIILFVVLVIFGAGKLPQVASQLGTGIRNFKESVQGEDTETEKQIEDKT